MTINPEQKHEFRNVWIKTAEQQLFHELETEYGFPRATCRSLVQLMQEFIEMQKSLRKKVSMHSGSTE